VRFFIPLELISRSWDFLRQRGDKQVEGMLLWAGVPRTNDILLNRLIIPAQIARRSLLGVCVEMDANAHLTLTDTLEPRERLFVRVHSHPEHAYHSRTDDNNSVITHVGAISVVVPRFGIGVPNDLSSCAIFEYSQAGQWRKLDSKTVAAKFMVA
jgi:hypothetical protein